LTLVTTHLSKNRIFRCYGIDTKSARERTFVVEKKGGDEPDSKRQRVEKSIYEYYKEKYKNLSFEYSNYPVKFVFEIKLITSQFSALLKERSNVGQKMSF
jgi:hypothetical protein